MPEKSALAHTPVLRIRSVGSTLAILCLLSGAALANQGTGECSNTPIVVKIHAEWCATCKALEPVWTRLGKKMGDQITAVTLDVTDRVAFQQSQAIAVELGLEKFFQKYRNRTGTIAVLECDSLEPVAVMNGERDLNKYLEAIAKASHAS